MDIQKAAHRFWGYWSSIFSSCLKSRWKTSDTAQVPTSVHNAKTCESTLTTSQPLFNSACVKERHNFSISFCFYVTEFQPFLLSLIDTHSHTAFFLFSSFNPKLLKEGKERKSPYNVGAQQCLVAASYLTLEAAAFLQMHQNLLCALFGLLPDRCQGYVNEPRWVWLFKSHPEIFAERLACIVLSVSKERKKQRLGMLSKPWTVFYDTLNKIFFITFLDRCWCILLKTLRFLVLRQLVSLHHDCLLCWCRKRWGDKTMM